MRLRWLVSFAALVACLAAPGCGHKSDTEAPPANMVNEFDSAVRDGDTSIVQQLLREKPGLANATDSSGKTPLQIATEKQDQEMADLLRKNGAKE